jgi:hypothetical protein
MLRIWFHFMRIRIRKYQKISERIWKKITIIILYGTYSAFLYNNHIIKAGHEMFYCECQIIKKFHTETE